MNTEDSEFARLEHEALLRASQPVVCHCDSKEWCEMYSTCHRKTCGFPPAQPVQPVQPVKEIMQMALDALEEHEYARTDKSLRLGHAAIGAIRAALAQPEQEPVALAKRILELEALLERQTARIVDLQTHIDNFDGEDR